MTDFAQPRYPRMIFDDTPDAESLRMTMASYDIWVSKDYGWFGDHTSANDIYLDYTVQRNAFLFPLRFSRLFRDPVDVGFNLAAQATDLVAPDGFIVTVEVDLCNPICYPRYFAMPVAELLRCMGLDTTHESLQPLLHSRSCDSVFLSVTIHATGRSSARPKLAYFTLTTCEAGGRTVLSEWFRSRMYARSTPLTPDDVNELVSENQDVVYVTSRTPDVADVYYLRQTLDGVCVRARQQAEHCATISRETSLASRWSLYRKDGSTYFQFQCGVRLYKHIVEALQHSRLLLNVADIAMSVYAHNDTRSNRLQVFTFEPYWREMRRVILLAARALFEHLTPFALLFVLDYLPLMWAFSRYRKMAHLERCYATLQKTIAARATSNKIPR